MVDPGVSYQKSSGFLVLSSVCWWIFPHRIWHPDPIQRPNRRAWCWLRPCCKASLCWDWDTFIDSKCNLHGVHPKNPKNPRQETKKNNHPWNLTFWLSYLNQQKSMAKVVSRWGSFVSYAAGNGGLFRWDLCVCYRIIEFLIGGTYQFSRGFIGNSEVYRWSSYNPNYSHDFNIILQNEYIKNTHTHHTPKTFWLAPVAGVIP